MQSYDFDEAAFFRSVAKSGARAVLIGRRALIVLGLPVMTRDYDFWLPADDAAMFNAAAAEQEHAADVNARPVSIGGPSSPLGVQLAAGRLGDDLVMAWGDGSAIVVVRMDDGGHVVQTVSIPVEGMKGMASVLGLTDGTGVLVWWGRPIPRVALLACAP